MLNRVAKKVYVQSWFTVCVCLRGYLSGCFSKFGAYTCYILQIKRYDSPRVSLCVCMKYVCVRVCVRARVCVSLSIKKCLYLIRGRSPLEFRRNDFKNLLDVEAYIVTSVTQVLHTQCSINFELNHIILFANLSLIFLSHTNRLTDYVQIPR